MLIELKVMYNENYYLLFYKKIEYEKVYNPRRFKGF